MTFWSDFFQSKNVGMNVVYKSRLGAWLNEYIILQKSFFEF